MKYHQCLIFVTILLSTCLTTSSTVQLSVKSRSSQIHKNELVQKTECNENLRKVLYVSLMNGEVCAVDMNDGSLLWSINTGSKLLSSSIFNLEVIYNGIPTKLIPSLDGLLFRFLDDSFEPLPFTAESLLSSSFKLPGDSTMVGSKELRTVGLHPSCGQVYYKCDKEGCNRRSDQKDVHERDILVVKHMTHTIRAASIRDGAEKWNFSVGHHELTFSESAQPVYTAGAKQNCESSSTSCDDGAPMLKFSVSEGLVMNLDATQPSNSVWEHKFSAPVSKSWVLNNGRLESLDLLDPKYFNINEWIEDGGDNSKSETNTMPPPSLYMGVFDKQLYIQPSEKLQKNVSAIAALYRRGVRLFADVPRVRWAPYIASTPSRTPFLNYGKAAPTDAPTAMVSKPEESALSVFNPTMDYPYDQGFYLTTELSDTADGPFVHDDDLTDDEDGDDGVFDDLEKIMIVQIVSLKYHWKEVLAISLLTAVVLNGILYATRRHRRRLKNKLKCFGAEDDVNEVSDVSEDEGKPRNRNAVVEPVEIQPEPLQPVVPLPPPPPYHSRYQSDFIHMQCLGKGGFGVVFHAQNALDECEYAIKRITLPNSDDAKEKVTREVKALAKLDHLNIVRYFQSWFETPPIGWQEDRDKIWESTERFMPTPVNSGYPISRQQSQVTKASLGEADSQPSVPKFKFDDSKEGSSSFGFPVNHRIDDSLDIVFASHTENTEQSVSTNQPFHKYAVAPAEPDDDSDDSGSDSEWAQFDDSGYHKNRMALIGTTRSIGSGESDDEASLQKVETTSQHLMAASKDSKKVGKPKHPKAKLFLYIQMQLCKRETLRDYLNANTLFRDKNDILLIFRQICDAVEYIHSQGLIHRDLKPTNIFFSTENVIKVGDFGLVTALSPFPSEDNTEGLISSQTPLQNLNLTNNVGTQIYMSPEQITGRQYNSKVDIYALGLVYFELKYPFSTMMERVLTLQGIKRHKYPERFVRELSSEYKFVKWMLSRNPNKRPSISAVLQSEVMSGSDELLHVNRIRTRTVSRSSSNE